MNKVLIITYYWPPSGGAGVQRWLKFSKFLPEFGWDPIILTVDPDYAAYPVSDHSLKEELPRSIKVHATPAINYFSIYKKDKSRIPTAGFANSLDKSLKGKVLRFIRGNFFIPDPRRGWNRYAFKKACDIIETEGVKHVITTSPPHSTQLIGLKIRKKYPEINWIADLRDPWTDIYYYDQFYPTYLSKKIDSLYEKRVLKKADRIITIGTSLKALFSNKVKGIADKIEVITNGYDEDDFSGIDPHLPEIFTISYIGTLSDIYPIGGLLDALQLYKEKGNEFRLRFVGTVSPKQKDHILSKPGISFVEFIPYVDHATSIRYMVDTNLLILVIPDHPSNKSIITGKLFEYIATGNPIVCIGPVDGDAAEIIKSSKTGWIYDYETIIEIEKIISKISQTRLILNKNRYSEYSRKNLTKHIADLLQS